MELILVNLKMASPSQEVHSKSEPHMVMLLPLSEQLLRLHLSIHACTYISVYLVQKYLSLYQNTAYHGKQGLKIQ